MLLAGLDGIQNKIHPGDPADKDLYDLEPEEDKKIPTVCHSLDMALDYLDQGPGLSQGGRSIHRRPDRCLHRAQDEGSHAVAHDHPSDRDRDVLQLVRCAAGRKGDGGHAAVTSVLWPGGDRTMLVESCTFAAPGCSSARGHPRLHCRGSGPGRLQVDRCAGRGALLRPARSGCGKDLHLERSRARRHPGPDGGTEPGPTPAEAADIALLGDRRHHLAGSQQTFTGGESVPVALSIDAGAEAGLDHRVDLNGAQVRNQGPDATQFTLTDLARGVYTIEATVTDPAPANRSPRMPSPSTYAPEPFVAAAQIAASSDVATGAPSLRMPSPLADSLHGR